MYNDMNNTMIGGPGYLIEITLLRNCFKKNERVFRKSVTLTPRLEQNINILFFI